MCELNHICTEEVAKGILENSARGVRGVSQKHRRLSVDGNSYYDRGSVDVVKALCRKEILYREENLNLALAEVEYLSRVRLYDLSVGDVLCALLVNAVHKSLAVLTLTVLALISIHRSLRVVEYYSLDLNAVIRAVLFDKFLKRVLMVAVRMRDKPRGDDYIILVDCELANSLVHKVGTTIVFAAAVVNEKSSVGEAVDISLTAVHKRGLTDRAKHGLADIRQTAAILVTIFRERAVYSSDSTRIFGIVRVNVLLFPLECGIYVLCKRALEELLISADIGVNTTGEILDELRDTVKENRIKDPEEVKSELLAILKRMVGEHEPLKLETKPSVILIIGVNGVGKTTSIGKIAAELKHNGKKVVVAAADTFRAAAAEQLSVWCDRAGVDIIKQAAGADPAAVVFDAINAVKSRKADVLIIDTAGRLHNKKNLMDELAKIDRVINRELAGCSKETLLVLDATTGQNAVMQAKEFKEASKITGLILTKLDGTAKGGIIISIKQELGMPVKFIGVGEQIDDMKPFNAQEFASALFERE